MESTTSRTILSTSKNHSVRVSRRLDEGHCRTTAAAWPHRAFSKKEKAYFVPDPPPTSHPSLSRSSCWDHRGIVGLSLQSPSSVQRQHMRHPIKSTSALRARIELLMSQNRPSAAAKLSDVLNSLMKGDELLPPPDPTLTAPDIYCRILDNSYDSTIK